MTMTMKDSRDKPSRTLPMVWFLLVLLGIRFIMPDFHVTEAIKFSAMSGLEFAAALTPIVGAWKVREYIDKAF